MQHTPGETVFTHRETVRFGQVDAAGIVFFPRYFDMLSNTVEAWFDEGLGHPWHRLHGEEGFGTPFLETNAGFVKASRLGDRLSFQLTVTDIARATFALSIGCTCDGEVRMTATTRNAFVTLSPLKAAPIPDALRARMERFHAAPAGDGGARPISP